MNEIEEFFKKAEKKLNSSKILYESGDYANSLSLSYYAMLLVSKALLIQNGITPTKHHGIIEKFGEIIVHKGEFNINIYKYLTQTEALRQQVDYEAIDDISEKIAKNKIKQAEEYIKEAKKFL